MRLHLLGLSLLLTACGVTLEGEEGTDLSDFISIQTETKTRMVGPTARKSIKALTPLMPTMCLTSVAGKKTAAEMRSIPPVMVLVKWLKIWLGRSIWRSGLPA